MIPMKLIYKEAHGARWTGLPYDERLGIASLAAVEAEAVHDPERGKFSTLATTYIRNRFRTEVTKHGIRMKYDGVQVSCLLPSQIPAAKLPGAEETIIFRDQLEKLSDDGRALANHALHPSKEVVQQKVTLKSLRDFLGWDTVRFNSAVAEIRSIF